MLVLALVAAGTLIWLVVQRQEERQLSSASVPQQEIVYTNEEFRMDTFVTQKAYGDGGEAAIAAVSTLLQELENTYSNYLPASEIGKVNAGAGLAAVETTPEVFELVERSVELSTDTGGVFDVTVAPLVKLWGITSDAPKVPSADEISNALSYVDAGQVVLDEEKHSIYLPRPGISLDLGAVVKGYAAQRCQELYEQQQNLDGALLSLGGTVVSVGKKPDGTAFQVGLRDPKGGANDIFGVLTGESRVIATSGGYERYFEQDGKRYEHILDPRTGYPAETDLLSVTAVSADGLLADFLSTSLYLLGSDAVLKNLNRSEFSVIAITNDNQILLSDDLKEKFAAKPDKGYTCAD